MTRIIETKTRAWKKHLEWEKQQEIKIAKDIRAKAKRRANTATARASRKKNRGGKK